MPDESCRKCGGQLLESKKCLECKQIFCWICSKCKQKTEEQFHYMCLNPLSNTPDIISKIKSPNYGLAVIT